MVTPWRTTAWPGTVSSQFPPCSAAMSTITLPGFMLRVHLALRGLEALTHDLGVTDAARAFFLVVHLDKLTTQRLDLVGHLGTCVIGAHDGAQVGCCADGREPRHASACDEHLGRRHLARRRDLAGEEAAKGGGGLDDGTVAA